MPVPRDIRQSDKRPDFGDSLAKCSYESGLSGDEFDQLVLDAAATPFVQGPQPGEENEKTLWVRVNQDYVLAYCWVVDRDKSGNAIFEHFTLLTIELG